jgi:hypothetical protein
MSNCKGYIRVPPVSDPNTYPTIRAKSRRISYTHMPKSSLNTNSTNLSELVSILAL